MTAYEAFCHTCQEYLTRESRREYAEAVSDSHQEQNPDHEITWGPRP